MEFLVIFILSFGAIYGFITAILDFDKGVKELVSAIKKYSRSKKKITTEPEDHTFDAAEYSAERWNATKIPTPEEYKVKVEKVSQYYGNYVMVSPDETNGYALISLAKEIEAFENEHGILQNFQLIVKYANKDSIFSDGVRSIGWKGMIPKEAGEKK